MASAEAVAAELGGENSTRHKAPNDVGDGMQKLAPMDGALDSLDLPADPDAQATVTDFLDFTEYLPSDMMRSLTLIGKLDEDYTESSINVHDLTTTWANMPDTPPEDRPVPAKLRADISRSLNRAVSSRVYSHAEAVRMTENVNRHYKRAQIILSKLQTLRENYPTTEEQKSPVATAKSPQMMRAPKFAVRAEGGGHKVRRQRVPRITVPGEVLAPYEMDYETFSEGSDSSSEEEVEDQPLGRTPGAHQRIKLVKNKSSAVKLPKTPRAPRGPMGSSYPLALSTSYALSQLKPPPENAVIGSTDLPWLELTPYELARLRKRMKKNALWAPSDTMIARELKSLGRGPDAYQAAKKKARESGQSFEEVLYVPAADAHHSGGDGEPENRGPSSAADGDDDDEESDREDEENSANQAGKESDLGKLAVKEAEAAARYLQEAISKLDWVPTAKNAPEPPAVKSSKRQGKRKRDSVPETDAVKVEASEVASSHQPPPKRTKTETPVPIPVPRLTPNRSAGPVQETPVPIPHLTSGNSGIVPHSTTPIPIPIPGQDASAGASKSAAASASPSGGNNTSSTTTVTTTIPIKPPGEAHIPPSLLSPRKSTTPILPPVRELRTRDAARKEQQKGVQSGPSTRQSTSRSGTPPHLPSASPELPRRPSSRGKAPSQEPLPSLAMDRPRRASTARNTPVPEPRQPSKRAKRPAPGVISRTNSGGNSAVGKRKAAPKKKLARAARREKGGGQLDQIVEDEVEVDDEGNIIDPDEPRYCLCNRVSFGMMIQCDNVDVCKQEWFHLECVGLSGVPARTTKWYCPDCRVLLNIGERGEVSARGVRA